MKIVTEILEKEDLNILDALDIVKSRNYPLKKIHSSETEVNILIESAQLF